MDQEISQLDLEEYGSYEEVYYDEDPQLEMYELECESPRLKFTYSGISNNSSSADFLLHSRMSEQNFTHVQFLEPTELYSIMEKMVSDIRGSLLLDDDLILYLLFQFRWNSEKLMEEYYDNLAIPYNYKHQIITNVTYPKHIFAHCRICCMEKVLYHNPLCEHYYCEGCWSRYIGECLREGQVFFTCMDGCKDAPVLLNHFIKKHFSNYYTEYRTNICRNYCQWSKTITYCPCRIKNCELFCSKAQTSSISTVQCLCGEVYCFHCRKDPHHPATCQDVIRWQQMLNRQQDNINWIKQNTKACPKCHRPVEKAIGCSLMKCICGTEFCYKCCGLWDEEHRGNMGECVKLVRKASLKEQATLAIFQDLQHILQTQSQHQKQHIQILSSIIADLDCDVLRRELIDLRKQVKEAWITWKWGRIVLFIYHKAPIDEQIDHSYLHSIHQLIQPLLQPHESEADNLALELLQVKDEVMSRKTTMINSQKVWMEAWRSR